MSEKKTDRMIRDAMKQVEIPEYVRGRISFAADTIKWGAEEADTARIDAARAKTSRAGTVREETAKAGTARGETAGAETARAKTGREETARADAAGVSTGTSLVDIQRARRARKRPRTWKAAWIAAAIVACTGITVFAAAKLYRFHVEQTAAHKIEIAVAEEEPKDSLAAGSSGSGASLEKNLTEVPAVDMSVGYLPEGLIDNSDEKGETRSWEQQDGQGGFFISEPIVIDEADGTWSEDFVQAHEAVEIGEREGLYVCSRYSSDSAWLWQDLYVPFPEVDRIVLINAWGHAAKEELMRIAEGITLKDTGETEPIEGQYTWSQYLAYKNEAADSADDTEQEVKRTAAAEEISNLYQMGDKISQEIMVNDGTDALPLSVKVTNMQILDNLSVLTATEKIPDHWLECTRKDGTLGTAARRYIRFGDGESSMNETVSEEEVGMKLVYVTLEYSNEAGQDMQDVYIFGSLLRMEEQGGTYRILRPDTKGAEDSEYNIWAGTGEMQYYDIAGEATVKNYIPEIKAGGTQTVHMAWLVGADETDNLYLTPGLANDVFTDEVLEAGLVQLKQD